MGDFSLSTMVKALVTGGAGFLGSHLCEKLLDNGHEVICVDNFFSGNKDNIRHLLSNPNFEMIRHDVQDPLSLHVDQIYHLACPASPIYYQFSALDTMKTSVIGTINLLELARRTRARFLITSTSEIYGDPLEHPQVESYWGNVNTLGVRSCYDEGKRAAETLTMDYYRTYDVDVRIARIFNSYGPRMNQNDGRVVSNFIVQALKDEDITIYGDGSQTRSFCYCKDTVDGIYALMNQEFMGPINLGNPVENTIKELATAVLAKIPDTKSKLIQLPLPSDDPTRRLPNIDRARVLLNWEPKVCLDEGLDRTIAHFTDLLKNHDVDSFEAKRLEKIRQMTVDREAQERRLRDQKRREQEMIDAYYKSKQQQS